MIQHRLTYQDITRQRGYGPLGHGTWLVRCDCGWRREVESGGLRHARIVGSDHLLEARLAKTG